MNFKLILCSDYGRKVASEKVLAVPMTLSVTESYRLSLLVSSKIATRFRVSLGSYRKIGNFRAQREPAFSGRPVDSRIKRTIVASAAPAETDVLPKTNQLLLLRREMPECAFYCIFAADFVDPPVVRRLPI